jgi:hypothetical protein
MASEPVERFAAEADSARARVASTIDAIQDRLDPRRLFGDTLERVSSGSAQLFGQVRQNAGSVVRSHPLAIGAAIAAVDEYGNYTDYDDGFGYVDPVPTASAAAPVARQRLGVAADRAREIAANAGSSIESNPIVSIVLGLAAGAILGALFPATEAERNFLAGKD